MNKRFVLPRKSSAYTRVEYLESSAGSRNNVCSYIQLPLIYDMTVDTVVFESEHEHLNIGNATNLELYNLEKRSLNWGYVDREGYTIRYDTQTNGGEQKLYFSQEDGFRVWRLECSPEFLRFYVDGNEKIIHKLQSPLVHNKVWPITLFGVITDDSADYSSWPFFCKKKYFAVWKNGVPIYHLIPVLDLFGIPCMYDLVSNQYFQNLGEVPFTAGPIISS